MNVSIQAKLGFDSEPIRTEKDSDQLNAQVDTAVENAQRSYQSLLNNRERLNISIKAFNSKSEAISNSGGIIQEICNIYTKECIPEFNNLVKHLRILNSLRYQVLMYMSSKSDSIHVSMQAKHCVQPLQTPCFGCAQAFSLCALKFFELSLRSSSLRGALGTHFQSHLYALMFGIFPLPAKHMCRSTLARLTLSSHHGLQLTQLLQLLSQSLGRLFNGQTILNLHYFDKEINVGRREGIKHNLDLLLLLCHDSLRASIQDYSQNTHDDLTQNIDNQINSGEKFSLCIKAFWEVFRSAIANLGDIMIAEGAISPMLQWLTAALRRQPFKSNVFNIYIFIYIYIYVYIYIYIFIRSSPPIWRK